MEGYGVRSFTEPEIILLCGGIELVPVNQSFFYGWRLWLMATDLPAIVRVAERAVVVGLAAIERVTMPVPVPLAPAVPVIQLGTLVVVQV